MTATDLSRLANILEEDSLPAWLRDEIDQRGNDILKALDQGHSFTLHGPAGEQIIVGPVKAGQHAPA